AAAARVQVRPALARLGSEAALQLRDFSRAAELARRAVPEDTRDYRDHLWLADVLTMAGRSGEARRVLDRLGERSGDFAEVWGARIRHLVREEEWGQAEDALARAQRRLSGNDTSPLGLGQCYEALAKVEQAERAYRLAQQSAPADPLVRRQLARFYLDHDLPEEALPHLPVLSVSPSPLPGHAARARRMLATLSFQVVALGRPVQGVEVPGSEEALKLLSLNRQAGKELIADRRARALVLGTDSRRRQEAVRLFEETLPLAPLTPEEQFRLAQLPEANGGATRAGEVMLSLLATQPRKAQVLARQVRRGVSGGE